jgi:hypothetical protein
MDISFAVLSSDEWDMYITVLIIECTLLSYVFLDMGLVITVSEINTE